jgi:TolB-like protein/DNA-binding winged helix-turn-helix (wHTH) protein/Tfp pilus assembly protein PilF
MSKQVKNIYEFGPFCLDPSEHTLLRDGRPIPIRPKMFDILLVLIENHGHLVDKEQLMSTVWTEQFVEEGNLNKNISMLRRVLGEGDNGQTFIQTVPKRGFRFVADVRELSGLDDAESVSYTTAPEVPATEESNGVTETLDDKSASKAEPVPKPISRKWFGVVALVVLLAGGLVYITSFRQSRPPVTPTITSIVVLPLQNLSGDPAQEYFVDGMTDALIGDLAQIGALRVISRTSAMHYKGTNKSLPEIAKELNVDAVVEGTVQRDGDRVHVRAQLIHAATDSHLWAADYDRDLRDVLDLQAEVAGAIASEVRIKITPAEQKLFVPRRVIARDAVDNYLQGRYFWNRRTERDLRQAVTYFEKAIKADPNYAQAYAGLADSYNQLGTAMIGGLPSSEARQTAEIAARKALEIDDGVAEAHVALGYVNFFNWNWAIAEAEFKRALQLNSNYAFAHSQYALYLVAQGRIDEALAEINRAQELDPLSLTMSMTRGYILQNARRYEESIEQLQRVIASDPNHYGAHWFLGMSYVANHQFEEAIAESDKAVTLSERAPAALGVLGLAYGLSGRKREANKVLSELLQLQKQRYVSQMALCYVYIGLGNKDQAFASLEKAYDERSNPLSFFKVSPTVDSLRSDPRFAVLLRRIGLDSESRPQ